VFMKGQREMGLKKTPPNSEIPKNIVVEAKFDFDESSMRKAFKVTFRKFFSPLTHVDEEISLQTGQEIFREAKLNAGEKTIGRCKHRSSWINFTKIKTQKGI